GQLLDDVALVEQDLPLQVARLDEVAVDDAQEADAGADHHIREHRTERPTAAQRHARRGQLLLPRLADAVETHLPAVAIQRRVHQSSSPSESSTPRSLKNVRSDWISPFGHFCCRAKLTRHARSSFTPRNRSPSSRCRYSARRSTASSAAAASTTDSSLPARKTVAWNAASSSGSTPSSAGMCGKTAAPSGTSRDSSSLTAQPPARAGMTSSSSPLLVGVDRLSR